MDRSPIRDIEIKHLLKQYRFSGFVTPCRNNMVLLLVLVSIPTHDLSVYADDVL